MSIPREWRPAPVADELRIGGQFDGGYVVPARVLRETDTLLSFGVSDNWNFEEEFCARRSGIRLLAFDCTIGWRFWLKRFVAHALAATFQLRFSGLSKMADWIRFKRFFSRENRELRLRKIGYSRAGDVTFASVMAEVKGDRVFLKCDIEGWEYRIMDQIVAHSRRLTGAVLELHDVDLMRNRISAFVKEMESTHIVTHVHANNFSGIDDSGDPLTLEMTFLSRSLCSDDELNGNALVRASSLDQPNNPERPEIELSFESSLEGHRQFAQLRSN